MYGVLLALLVLDGLFLTVIVLLQAGKGGGLAAMGGSGGTAADALIGGRQAATLLTKATWAAGGVFLALALVLSVMSSRASAPNPLLREEFQGAPAAPQPLNIPGTQPAPPPAGSEGRGARGGAANPAGSGD